MEREDIISTLKHDLGVQKEIIALQVLQQPPSEIPHYRGEASPGMCALVGEILQQHTLWYVTRENLGCFEALTGTGTCENLPREQYLEFMIGQNRNWPMHKDTETLIDYYTRVDAFFRHPEVSGSGLVVGPLARVEQPDLVLLFVTPHQADILSRILAFYGDFARGFGGMGGCIFNIRYTFMTGDPCFSTSDTAWRMFAGLDESELTYTFPYGRLLEIGDRIRPTAGYVNAFKSMF